MKVLLFIAVGAAIAAFIGVIVSALTYCLPIMTTFPRYFIGSFVYRPSIVSDLIIGATITINSLDSNSIFLSMRKVFTYQSDFLREMWC